MNVANDPIDQMLASAKAASDQNLAFYSEHLDGVVRAYRANKGKYDRDALLNLMVRALVESDNSREALCYQIICAVDKLSRR